MKKNFRHVRSNLKLARAIWGGLPKTKLDELRAKNSTRHGDSFIAVQCLLPGGTKMPVATIGEAGTPGASRESPIRTRDQMPRERCLIREPLNSVTVFSEPVFHL
jgi:hypothetical protein